MSDVGKKAHCVFLSTTYEGGAVDAVKGRPEKRLETG